jgi:hypothetical protein
LKVGDRAGGGYHRNVSPASLLPLPGRGGVPSLLLYWVCLPSLLHRVKPSQVSP